MNGETRQRSMRNVMANPNGMSERCKSLINEKESFTGQI